MERRWTKAEQQVGRLTRHGSLDQSRYDFVHDIGPYRGKILIPAVQQFLLSSLSLSLLIFTHGTVGPGTSKGCWCQDFLEAIQ